MINPAEIDNIARSEERLWWFRGMREITVALLDRLMTRGRPVRVLEGGCGTGQFAEAVARRYGVTVIAADLDPQAARICRDRPGVIALRSNLLALPLESARFDLVVTLDALVHLRPGEDEAAIRECARVLRPGGALLLRAAALRLFRSRHSEFVWERQRFTPRRLRELAASAGLRVERLTFANFLLSPASLLRFRVWEPLFQRTPQSGLQPLPWPLEAVFYRALWLERAWLARGRNLPFGQTLFLVARKP